MANDITFRHIHETDLSESQILLMAKNLQGAAKSECGVEYSLQFAVDCVIDAAIESAQG